MTALKQEGVKDLERAAQVDDLEAELARVREMAACEVEDLKVSTGGVSGDCVV